MQLESDKQNCISDPLQDSEALLRAMIENLPGGAAFVVDPDLRYRLAEGKALSVAGFKPEDLVGRTIFEVLPPDLAVSYEVMYRKGLAGEAFEHEHSVHVRGASPQENRFYISRGTPLRSASGEIYAVLAVSYDITDRKRVESVAAADLEDTQRLRELGARLVAEGNIQGLYQEIIAAAIALMRADAGTVQILDKKTQDLLLLATQGFERNMTDRFYRVNASLNTPCGIALLTGDRTFVDFDVPESEDPDGSLRMHVEAGYLSAQSTPLIARSGKRIGMVSTHWRKHHRPSDRELRFLDLLARQAADSIEQQQAEAALRESEAHFRAFVNASSDIVYRMSADWSVMHNLDGKQFIASTTNPKRTWLDEYIPSDEQPRVWTAIESAIQTKSNFELEHRVFREDGTSGWTFSRAIPLLNEQGDIIEWFGAASDISDRKQAEVELRESEEKYRSLFNSMDEAYAVVEVMTDENGEWNDFLFLEVNPAFVAQTGMEYPVGRKATELLGTPNPQWAKVYGQVAATGEPIRLEEGEATLGRVFDLYVFRLGGDGSRRVAVLFTDITERKRREANLAFLADLMSDFAPLATAEEIMEMAGKRIAEHLNLSRYLFVEINPEAGECTYLLPSCPAGQLEIGGSYILADYHTEEENRLLSAGHSMVVNDVRDGTRSPEQMAAFEAFDIASIVNTPYLSNGRWVFDLGVTRSKPSVWREDEIELLREISARVWLRIERARTEVDLRQSEAKYRSLFNSMDEGYFLCDVIFDENDRPIDLFYIDENPAAIRMTGQSFRGQRLREINPNYEEYWYEIFGRVAQTGQAERLERYAAPDQIWYDFYVFKVASDDQGRVAVVFNDITDRKRTEAQLRRAGELDAFRVKLSDALRSLSDLLEIQEVATRLLGEHLGADRVLYFDVQEEHYVVEREHSPGLPPFTGRYPTASFSPWLMGEYQAGRTAVTTDISSDDRMGSTAQASYSAILQINAFVAVPLVKGGRFVAGLSALMTNARNWTQDEILLVEETAERTWATIERARAEKALQESEIKRIREQSAREEERQRAESLAELDRAKTTFFSNVSHEFRTPLTLLLAPLQDILSDRDNPVAPEQRERLELAYRNATRLLKLVNTLLDFSRIEAGRMEAVYEPTDLTMFTTELASVFRSAIEQAGLRLIVDCLPLPEAVYVDREMWEKIVLNLLSNAFKFTLQGEITVRLHPIASHVILEIEDTGVGIAPEDQPHLFERFYQVRGTQARSYEGSGIGLALVQELVQVQGGTINVSTTQGRGTCFTIALPFGSEHLPSDRVKASRTLSSTAIGAVPYLQEAELWRADDRKEMPSNARVLLVDDNADMREYLTRILCDRVQVEAVADGTAALLAAQARVPDLILSDVMMPGLNGFKLLQALRSDPRTREVPIVLLSARAGEEAIVEGLEAGADDYLIKPFSAQELISRVTAYLQMAQLRGEALQEARSTIRNRDEFISVVSHELNTPLVSILGWTRLLRANPPSPAMLTKALDTIERNATLQGKLVQDLLDISRISAGKLRLNPQPIELESVIETAIATVAQTAANKGINLTWQKNFTGFVVVMGDSDRLSQVFINLLTNAIKFTPESGSVKVELSISNNDHSVDAAYAEIRAIDTGIGIASDFLPHVFDRFRQAEGVHSAKGLGLGLAIASSIVELHNGTIHAESSGVGQGATFIIRLPLFQDDES